jgi:hypothetical protein
MDPIANLKDQLRIARRIRAVEDDCNSDGTLMKAQEEYLSNQACLLAELVLALDEWMSKGGFSPWGQLCIL